MKVCQAGINFFLIVLVGCLTACAQNKQGTEVVFWKPGERLDFSDFKAKPKQDSANNSTVNNIHKLGVIVKSIDVQIITSNDKTVFTIYAGMIPGLSWIKTSGDSITLRHEQGHFDICEIYARRLRKDIRNVASIKEAKKLYNKISLEEEAEHDIYDSENKYSNGGIIPAWRKKIERQLLLLQQYQQPVVEMVFRK
ncbi:MAG: hypothetical protein V4717_03845 [Bacteroidota bacterium]